MDSKTRDIVARHLQAELEQTETTMRSFEQQLEPREGDCGVGRMTTAEPDGAQRATMEALQLERRRYESLRAAQSRLGDDDFGICKVCRQPIPNERLLIVPESTVCQRCKS